MSRTILRARVRLDGATTPLGWAGVVDSAGWETKKGTAVYREWVAMYGFEI